MPELPEVETVRRGLAPFFNGARFAKVEARRADLRFALPENFATRLEAATVHSLDRRGKYLIASLSTGESLIMHLGMSGRFTIIAEENSKPGHFVHQTADKARHDHIVFHLDGARPARVVYNDPRRFGFMDLVASDHINECRHFDRMGPEPLSNSFSLEAFEQALRGRGALIKNALLDQQIIAGLGNIYACEALFRAGISPRRRAATIPGRRAARLLPAIRQVLQEAIEQGGSSLRDFAHADGALGYFQHGFQVYDREGAPCLECGAPVRRLTQGGRSTFYCSTCQR